MGAVLILREEWAWYPWGSTTPAEAAAAWNDIIVKAYDDSLEFGCPAPLLAPFWDSATDVDDQADFSDQVWYGTLAVS